LRHSFAIAFLVILFLITRVFLFTGFPFSMNFLDMGMQMMDPDVLQGDLLKGLFYNHTEPPLFNVFVGMVLKATPDRVSAHMVFLLIYGAIGIFLVLGIYMLALNIGASRFWSLSVAAVFAFWPPCIYEQIYHHPPMEKWLSYDYPILALLLAMALSLANFTKGSKPVIWASAFLIFSATAALTRPFFHPLLWYAPSMFLVLYLVRNQDPGSRQKVLAVSAVALILVASVTLKNGILFGSFSESSFHGMNIASRTLFLSPEILEKEVSAGLVTPLALIPRFSEPEVYLNYYGEKGWTGNRFLDRVDKSTGHPNWNNLIMVRASYEYQDNTMALLSVYPLELVKTTLNGIYIFFGFEPHQFLWPPGMAPWGFWNVSFPAVDFHGASGILRYVLAPLIFACVYFLVLSYLLRRREDPVALFMAFALVYVFVVANLGELGHNGILRTQIDPLLFAGAALWITQAIARFAQVHSLRSGSVFRVPGS